MLSILKHKYFKFGLISLLYLLFIIWLGNFWFLLGLPVIFDMYVTKKVNWTFWKKRNEKNNAFIEWLDALIFAVVAVTLINIYLFQNYRIPTPSMESTMLVGDHLYVSKVAYGPRAPITPLSFPFAQNRMLNGESYLKWIQLDYKRLKGFGQVKRDDIVVFNFPAGDTVAVENSASSIYNIYRSEAMRLRIRDINSGRQEKSWDSYVNQARKLVLDNYSIVVRPSDRRDNYIKRCVAVHGDSLEIIDGKVFINGTAQPDFKGIQYDYRVKTNGRPLNPRALEDFDLPPEALGIQFNPNYTLPLTREKAELLKTTVPDIVSVDRIVKRNNSYLLFPHSDKYSFSEDNFGPIWIPAKGESIKLDEEALIFYRRIIEAYEGNTLAVKEGKIFLNGEEANSYTFKQDYFWMMGDNRHSSSDSRYWGYVPEDHIIGKPKFVWLSLDNNKRFPEKIRFKRFFKLVDAAE